MYKPDRLPCISAFMNVFYHTTHVKLFCQHMEHSIPWWHPILGKMPKEKANHGGESLQPVAPWGPWILVLTAMANSKPTKLQPHSVFCPRIFVYTSSRARTGGNPFFNLSVHSETFSWSSSLRNILSFPPDLFFPLDPCNIKPFPTWSLPCLIHLNM